MPIDLYYLPASAPCRSVILTAKALGLDLNLKVTNLQAGEHLTPEYIKAASANNKTENYDIVPKNSSNILLEVTNLPQSLTSTPKKIHVLSQYILKQNDPHSVSFTAETNSKEQNWNEPNSNGMSDMIKFENPCHVPIAVFPTQEASTYLPSTSNFEVLGIRKDPYVFESDEIQNAKNNVNNSGEIENKTFDSLFNDSSGNRDTTDATNIENNIPGSHITTEQSVKIGISTELNKSTKKNINNHEMNPQHTIPTINDNGFCLWESRAILAYLVNAYGKDDSLYPKDPKKRAIVDQRLYFDIGTLYARFADYYYPVYFTGASFDPAKLEKINDAMKFLDLFLEGSEYAAGDHLTIADIALVATVSTYDVVGYDFSPYKNISRWFSKAKKTVPGYAEDNGPAEFKKFVDNMTKK